MDLSMWELMRWLERWFVATLIVLCLDSCCREDPSLLWRKDAYQLSVAVACTCLLVWGTEQLIAWLHRHR